MATDSNLPPEGPDADDFPPEESPADALADMTGRIIQQPIEDELKDSYLTYAMSVIVSRALPDVRDGLKPSQRRILVAMNDLNLTPGAGRVKCAKISGDTSGNYHPARRKRDLSHPGPHGPGMEHAPRAGRQAGQLRLDRRPAAGGHAVHRGPHVAHRRARCSRTSSSTRSTSSPPTTSGGPEPTVLPSKFPNLLVNGANGIAVGMATSIPPHNLGEICDALIRVIDDPDVSIDELMEIVPGPDFPTGGIDLRPQRHPPRLPHRPRHDRRPRPGARSRSTARTATASSSARSPSSRPATASKSGSPRWSTRGGSPASPPSATKAT